MGLLNSNSLNQWLTQTLPQNARNLWGEIKQAPRDLRGLISPEMNTQVRQQMNKPATLDRNAAMGMAMDYLQTTNPMGGLLAHTVYHGSPHKFNKFDMSKIGTGEGAQAYGHGLYFAEAPEVANKYAENVAIDLKGKYLGPKLLGNDDASSFANIALQNSYDDIATAAKYARKMSPNAVTDEARESWDKAAEMIESLPKMENPGNLYKVDIPDEAIPRMLDWDAPLSKQSPEVRDAINRAGREPASYGVDKITDDMRMVEFKKLLNSPEGTQKLKELGIPGIRYLDGSSRNVGEGTSNFVLFDDQLPRILEINGQPTGLLSYADEAKKAATKNVSIDSLKLNEGGASIAKAKWAWEPNYVHKNNAPVRVDMATNEVLDGYHRIEQARRNGQNNIDVVYVDLSDEARKALGLLDVPKKK